MTDYGVVPYIALWSGEQSAGQIVTRLDRNRVPVGIAFADEVPGERDSTGVLWCRMTSAPGLGRPLFGKVHPLRQRRAMRRLLCQVCGHPADVTEDGALWLFPDAVTDLPGWPELVINGHPPVCRPCAVLSVRLCPSLRRSCVAVRARSAVSAVGGILCEPGYPFPTPGDDVVVPFGDPRSRWTLATELVRNLHDCAVVELDRLAEATPV